MLFFLYKLRPINYNILHKKKYQCGVAKRKIKKKKLSGKCTCDKRQTKLCFNPQMEDKTTFLYILNII